jgi:phosphatidylserine/phosphatidylglycerophosphate/cardiolipin synthase-like enzyme
MLGVGRCGGIEKTSLISLTSEERRARPHWREHYFRRVRRNHRHLLCAGTRLRRARHRRRRCRRARNLVNAYAFTSEMREFLGNLYKEISIENSQKLVTYRYRRAGDRQSKLVLVDLAVHRDVRGSGILAALNRAHARGINVRLVADRRAPCDLQEGVSALAAVGIPIWIDVGARVAHEKALIIDRRVTIMGNYNWSKGAASNSEDLNVVTSAEVAETYARHWQARQALSIRFADASQWCRR